MSTNGGTGPDSIKLIRNGVRIEKSLEGGEESPVGRVRFELTSKRGEPTAVRFVDAVPEPFSTDGITFEPGREEEWRVEGPHRLAFETVLPPRGEHVTHYAVREPADGNAGRLLQLPTVEAVEAVDDVPATGDTDGPNRATEGSDESERRGGRSPGGGGLGSLKSLLFRRGDAERGGPDRAPEGQETTRNPPTMTARVGPVTVERSLAVRDAGIAVTLTVAAEDADGPVSVTVVDPLPAAWPLEAIGFHPERGSERGAATRDGVFFEGIAGPGDPLAVTYGFSPRDEIDPDELEGKQASQPPRVERTEPADQGSAGREASTLEEIFEAAPGGEGNDGGDTGAGEGDDGSSDDGTLASLVGEIESGAATEEQLSTLRDALGAGTSGRVDARLRHLESRVTEVDAYADAMAELLDEHGSATAVIDDLRGEIAALREDLAAVEDAIDDAADERARLRDRLEALAEDVDEIDERTAVRLRRSRRERRQLRENHDRDVDALEDGLDALEADFADDVEGLCEAIEEIRGEIEETQARWEALADALR